MVLSGFIGYKNVLLFYNIFFWERVSISRVFVVEVYIKILLKVNWYL